MASNPKESHLRGRDHPEEHASDNRWRHQESSAFARHAALSAAPKKVREADSHNDFSDLADFLNKSRIEPSDVENISQTHKPILVDGHKEAGPESRTDVPLGGNIDVLDAVKTDGREVRCGPLLNYRGMDDSTWFGSVLIVTKGGIQDGDFVPVLKLRRVQDVPSDAGGLENTSRSLTPNGVVNGVVNAENLGENRTGLPIPTEDTAQTRVEGTKLYADPQNVFWRFHLSVEIEDTEGHWEYEIPGLRFPSGTKKTDKQSFFVAARNQSMKIMFHSCNGFSVGTDEAAWSGPALWNDVLRVHKERRLSLMIGGGDQIYNDGVRVHGPLQPWSAISNPQKRRDFKFSDALKEDCDNYYAENYIQAYSKPPFSECNGQIPQLNMWDDHDLLDGYGSYFDLFMRAPVFKGIGRIALKYYLLFQLHLPPPVQSTDTLQTEEAGLNGVGVDPAQVKDTFVLQSKGNDEECGVIIGPKPGPYISECSRSIYARLGARMALIAIDARTERTRHQVNYPETYNIIFDRLRKELAAAAASSPLKHLIVVLGIPIAYPRLTWLENILRSPLIGPVKFLNKRFGIAGSFFNHFDGSVELLDDLDDHYTARTHKRERLGLILELQNLAAEFSVRVSILGGDIHQSAIGRFYGSPKLSIPIIADHRYMANIISSAIVNKPPPTVIANLMARRNKIHHLDESTDETLLNIFDKNPGLEAKTASWNHVTMPARNWAMITENPERNPIGGAQQGNDSRTQDNGMVSGSEDQTNGLNGTLKVRSHSHYTAVSLDESTGKDGHHPLHPGEVNAGTQNRAATAHGESSDGSLDVCIRVEKDQHNPDGATISYGFWIPPLKYTGDGKDMRKRDNIVGTVNART